MLALLHPELASCPRLTVESDLVVLYPDTPCSSLRERLEGVVRGEWGEHKQDEEEALMSYPPPVECEVNEMEFDCDDSMDPYDSLGPSQSSSPVPRIREKKNQTFTHAQKLEFVRLCNAMGGNVLLTARSLGLQAARLRAWKEQEQVLEAQVMAGEGGRSKAVNLAPKPLRPFEERLLDWLKGAKAEIPTRKDVSLMALELYKEEVSDPGAQKRFKAGSTYVEQFLAKTKTKDLVAASPEDPDADEQKDVYACDECGQTFSAKSSLRHHKVYNHSNADKPFACPHCDRGFKSSENLKIHVRTHTGEKPYNCDLCGYASSDPSNFRKHQKNHHNRIISSKHYSFDGVKKSGIYVPQESDLNGQFKSDPLSLPGLLFPALLPHPSLVPLPDPSLVEDDA